MKIEDVSKKIRDSLDQFVGRPIKPDMLKNINFALLESTGHFDVPAHPKWCKSDLIDTHVKKPVVTMDMSPDNTLNIEYKYDPRSAYDVGRCSIDYCTVQLEVEQEHPSPPLAPCPPEAP